MSIQKQLIPLYGAQLISVGSGFLSTLFLARLLGPSLQGEWALYMQFTQFSSLAFSLGLPPALIYFLASGKINKTQAQHIVNRICLMAASLLTLFTVAYAFSANRWILPDTLLHSWLCLFIPFHCTALLWIQFQGAILQAQNQFRRFAWIQSAGMLLQLSGILIYYLIPGSKPHALHLILGLYVGISLVQIGLLKTKKQAPELGGSLISIPFNALIQYASLAFATNFIQFLNYKIDVWFLRYFQIHSAAIGIYTLSVSLSQLVWLLPQALQSILFRDIAQRNDRENLYRESAQWTVRIATYLLPACVFGAYLAEYLIPVLFGLAYAEVANMIQLLLLGIGPFGLIMVMSAYFSGTGRVYINFVSAVLGFAVGVYADWLWIPTMGIQGAALASIASYWSTTLFVFIIFFYEKRSFD